MTTVVSDENGQRLVFTRSKQVIFSNKRYAETEGSRSEVL